MALTASPEQSNTKRTIIIAIVIAAHAAGIWVMESGLSRQIIELVAPPVETKIIEEQKDEEPPPPPPPPPDMPAQPPPFIPPPEVNVTIATQTNAISVATNEKPPEVVPPVMAPPPPVKADTIEQPTFARPPENLDRYYPASAKREDREGSVVVVYTVGVDGRVTNIEVETSSGFPDLDQGAVDYVKTWRFKAGKRNGVAEAMQQRKKITFKLTR